MKVRLTQLDGKLPNLALMKLAHWHKARGDEVVHVRSLKIERGRDLVEDGDAYGRVYGSAIFAWTAPRVAQFKRTFPNAIVGGTWSILDPTTIEQTIGVEEYEHYDYSIAPEDFKASIGFTQRGCRLKCKFCVVPVKEGKPRSVNTINDIWRGGDFPKQLHLLDNDFFGQSEWEKRVEEIIAGDFKVCLNQGINVRLITEEGAAALAKMNICDDQFKTRRIYTAWDNLKDEKIFFRGVDTLVKHGVSPAVLMAYMLIGFDPTETWERVLYRFERMVELKIRPYPMIYGDRKRTLPIGNADPRLSKRTLVEFQRWAIRRLYEIVPFVEYDTRPQRESGNRDLFSGETKNDSADEGRI